LSENFLEVGFVVAEQLIVDLATETGQDLKAIQSGVHAQPHVLEIQATAAELFPAFFRELRIAGKVLLEAIHWSVGSPFIDLSGIQVQLQRVTNRLFVLRFDVGEEGEQDQRKQDSAAHSKMFYSSKISR